MALALAKAERDHKVAEEQRVYAAQAEAAAKADMLPAWLQSGGTKENFNAAWPRMWEEELIRRSREHEGDLKQRMLVATDNSGI